MGLNKVSSVMVSGGSGSDLDADLLDATKTGIISNKPRFMK